MFAPTQTWRRGLLRVNTTQKRYDTCSALAASALPALVVSVHHIEQVPELLWWLKIQLKLKKTKEADLLLKKLKA